MIPMFLQNSQLIKIPKCSLSSSNHNQEIFEFTGVFDNFIFKGIKVPVILFRPYQGQKSETLITVMWDSVGFYVPVDGTMS